MRSAFCWARASPSRRPRRAPGRRSARPAPARSRPESASCPRVLGRGWRPCSARGRCRGGSSCWGESQPSATSTRRGQQLGMRCACRDTASCPWPPVTGHMAAVVPVPARVHRVVDAEHVGQHDVLFEQPDPFQYCVGLGAPLRLGIGWRLPPPCRGRGARAMSGAVGQPLEPATGRRWMFSAEKGIAHARRRPFSWPRATSTNAPVRSTASEAEKRGSGNGALRRLTQSPISTRMPELSVGLQQASGSLVLPGSTSTSCRLAAPRCRAERWHTPPSRHRHLQLEHVVVERAAGVVREDAAHRVGVARWRTCPAPAKPGVTTNWRASITRSGPRAGELGRLAHAADAAVLDEDRGVPDDPVDAGRCATYRALSIFRLGHGRDASAGPRGAPRLRRGPQPRCTQDRGAPRVPRGVTSAGGFGGHVWAPMEIGGPYWLHM